MIDDGDIDEALKLCNSIQTASRNYILNLMTLKKHPKQLKKGTRSLEEFQRERKN